MTFEIVPKDRNSLTQTVKAEAHRLGFHLVGAALPNPSESYPVYENWLEAGRHGEMLYLAAEPARLRRSDPRQILPECRSILVLGMRYFSPQASPPPPETGLPHGRVASYAWGDDYHEVLPERLRALAAFIEEQVGHPVPNRWYTDTGPILEREMAQRAGIGWIGKNSCLIDPHSGSYYILSEILLGIDLEPDSPLVSDHCGTCTRCIDACPTSCILPDRTLDARRCLSYLTIELKGPIPTELRPALGEWVFGCDICQAVCPWNIRFAAPQGEPAFAPRPGVPSPELITELQVLTRQAFNQKFKGSPVKRAKRRGYLRNAAVVLGNRRDPRSVPSLIGALGDAEPLVRGHAAWALGQIGGPQSCAALRRAADHETDPWVQEEISAALNAAG